MSISTAAERRAASDFWGDWPTLLPDTDINASDRAHIQAGYYISGSGGGGLINGTLPESVDGDFSLVGWYNKLSVAELPFTCWDIGSLAVEIINNGGTHQLQISDGVNSTINVDLSADGSEWFNVIVVRSGTSILVYENNTLMHTEAGWSVIDYGTAISAISSSAVEVADLRVLNIGLSAADIGYYYDDVIDNAGNEVMPRWL